MDGHFVPNISLGPVICAATHRAVPNVFLDVHLMVTDPARWVDAFADAGAGHIQFHVEVVPRPASLVEQIRARGMTAGIVLNPDTPASACFDALPMVDTAMLMSVHPGRSGQSFIASVLSKGPELLARMRPEQRLMIDGGVSPATAPACRAAGCSVLISATAIFGTTDYAGAIAALRG
jgi:ribulose-phosphate 3-epimerase